MRSSFLNNLSKRKPQEATVPKPMRICVGLLLVFLPFILTTFWVHPVVSQTNLSIPQKLPGYNFAQLPRISSLDDIRLQRRQNESPIEFADRILKVVNLATYHCAFDDAKQSWWTWLAANAGLIDMTQGVLTTSTFVCGYCHQRAFILAKALRRGGIEDAAPYGLNGHVVTIYNANGKRYAIDADYGVRSFEFPENSVANVIASHYLSEAPGYSPDVYTKISDFYASPDDNDYYYNYDFLVEIAVSQRKILSLEPLIGWLISALGVAILFAPALLSLSRKQRI